MPLSNAERQKRHRERTKARLTARADVTENTILRAVTQFIAEYNAESEAEEAARGEPVPRTSVEWFFENFYKGTTQECCDVLGPVLYAAMGLPADPWPELTAPALEKLIGRRLRVACDRGICIGFYSGQVLTPIERFMALRNREWLETRSAKRKTR
jgi:hypothetical protein